MSTQAGRFHIAVLPGDGIGPEVMAPVLDVLAFHGTAPDIMGKGVANPRNDFIRCGHRHSRV